MMQLHMILHTRTTTMSDELIKQWHFMEGIV